LQESFYKVGGSDEADSCRLDVTNKLQSLFPMQEYVRVTSSFLWEMHLAVFCRRRHLSKISNVVKSQEATGIGHVCGNKGGIGIKLQFMETSICFISSHLAAFQEGVENRNENFREIIQGLHLDPEHVDATERFHYVFWMGDLNYRIDLPREQVVQLVQDRNFERLHAFDQLKREMTKGTAFKGFQEGPLSFPPTYRYLRNVSPREYDEAKARIPAWCDRILWRSFPGLNITQEWFSSVDSVVTSDHSPVHALFTAEILRTPRNLDGRRSAVLPGRFEISFSNLTLALDKRVMQAGDTVSLVSEVSPYIRFSASFLSAPFQTSVKNRTCEPNWKDESVSSIVMVSSREYLKRQFLYLSIMDHNVVAEDAPLGYGVVALGPALAKPPAEGDVVTMAVRKSGIEVCALPNVPALLDPAQLGTLTSVIRVINL